jgi:predicted lipoprotein with Yx(FWY)xxD motif
MKTVPLVVLCALIIAVPSVWANWVQDGVALCTATDNQYGPVIVSDGAGGAIVAWYDQRSGNSDNDIYTQRVNASGTPQWTANGVALCSLAGDQEGPQIISDDAGGAIVAWYDHRSGSYDIYAQRVNASGAVQWTANGVALCTATGNQYSSGIVSDGAGGAIVAWDDQRSGNYDIYVQRVNASGVVQWTANGVALCTATGSQYAPTIVSDGAGGAFVTWYDNRGGNYDIYAQRVNASGAVQWTANGVPLCTATGDQYNPMIVSDGASGAIVTWYDQRGGTDYDIYAQRVNASGAAQWTADGVALCTATKDQMVPAIASDGVGGAIVTWYDKRNGSDNDIYAQRVNASGAVQWTANGVALCTAYGDDYYPAITSDGLGGSIVTWMDIRAGINHIYAQRVNASGAVQWTANGVALCTAAGGAQIYPTIISDGYSGAIVTWQDRRNGTNWDIYGLRVDANGLPVLTASDTPAVPVELRQNYPNPFNPATAVAYSVPARCNVTLKIFDASGRCVACLVEREQGRGSYTVEWNGKDEKGNSLASGIYLCRLAAGNQTASKKMVLLR